MLKANVFICGCPHSGTTLLANMFAAHPKGYTPLRETALFFSRIVSVRLAQQQIAALLRGKRYLIEKTPAHITRIDTIREKVRSPKIIMLVRNGCDVAAGHVKRFNNAERGIDSWIEAGSIIENESGKPDTILLRYEDLIADPEKELRRLCSFVGMPFSAQMMEYHKSKRAWFGERKIRESSGKEGVEHRQLRNWQVNQPIFDGTGKWRAVFDSIPSRLANGKGAALMRSFGYSDTED